MTREGLYRFLYRIGDPLSRILYPHTYYGRENVPDGPAIIIAPHSNAPDPILVSLALGDKHYVRHLAKAETRKIPFLNWLMKKAGSIFIRRGESDIEGFKQCIRALKAGDKLMIFPEGTRVHGSNTVPPKIGAFRLAAKLHVPILPVYIPRDKKVFRHMDVVIGEPYYVEADAHADYNALAREGMDRVWALKERIHG